MTQFSKVSKNIQSRLILNRLEKKRKIFNFLLDGINVDEVLISKIRKSRISKIRKSRISKIRNQCILTYRNRGVISKYKISRHAFKLLASQGKIPGLIKP